MQPLPMRMRRRIVELYESGKGTAEIAAAMAACPSGTRRIRQVLRERGTLEPARVKPGPAGGLTADRADELRAAVAAAPGTTRAELRDRLGVTVDVRTVGRWLARLAPHLVNGGRVVFVCPGVEDPNRKPATMAGSCGGPYLSAEASARGEWEPGGYELPAGTSKARPWDRPGRCRGSTSTPSSRGSTPGPPWAGGQPVPRP